MCCAHCEATAILNPTRSLIVVYVVTIWQITWQNAVCSAGRYEEAGKLWFFRWFLVFWMLMIGLTQFADKEDRLCGHWNPASIYCIPAPFMAIAVGSGRTSGDLPGVCLHLWKLLITCCKSENYSTSLKLSGTVVKGSVWGLMIQLSTTPGIPQQPVSAD